MTVLIPLVGYFVIFNESLLHYTELSRYIFGDVESAQNVEAASHVSWRLLFMYFGLCFLGIGSTIYYYFCPDTIKQFGTSTDFIAATRSHMGDVMLGRMESRLNADPLSSQEFSQLQSLARDRAETARRTEVRTPSSREAIFLPVPQGETASDRVYDRYWRDLLDLNFRTDDRRRPVARLATLVLYAIGLQS